LGIYPKEYNSTKKTDTYAPLFKAALSVIVKLWDELRHPTTNEWLNKVFVYVQEYYSALKKNEMMLFAGKWMEM
jgi:hypothetical protein